MREKGTQTTKTPVDEEFHMAKKLLFIAFIPKRAFQHLLLIILIYTLEICKYILKSFFHFILSFNMIHFFLNTGLPRNKIGIFVVVQQFLISSKIGSEAEDGVALMREPRRCLRTHLPLPPRAAVHNSY